MRENRWRPHQKESLTMKPLIVSFRKWVLLGTLIILSFIFFYYHLYDYLNFNTLKIYQSKLLEWTNTHYKIMITFYMIAFTFMIASALPSATFLTLLGGFLFGTVAVVYAMFAITLGGVILYLAVRSAVGNDIKTRSSGWIKKMEAGFQENAFNYLLTLRLVPIFPCWFSNISAGALNIPLKTFISATVIGIMPSTFIYVMVGRSLDKFFDLDQTPSFHMIFTPSLLFPLLGLALLSLLPVIIKYTVSKRGKKM